MSNLSQHPHNQGDEPEVLARRSVPLWNAAIDELSDDNGWVLELESSQIYFTLKVLDLSVLSRAVYFLNAALTIRLPKKPPFCAEQDDLALGFFGNAPVHLLRDNEDFIRCFLVVVGAGEPSTLRISLDAENIRALAEALDCLADSLSTDHVE